MSSRNVYIHGSLTPSTRNAIRAAYARKIHFLSLAKILNISQNVANVPPEEDNWLDRELASTRFAEEVEEFLRSRAQSEEGIQEPDCESMGADQDSSRHVESQSESRDVAVESLIEKAKRARLESVLGHHEGVKDQEEPNQKKRRLEKEERTSGMVATEDDRIIERAVEKAKRAESEAERRFGNGKGKAVIEMDSDEEL
jgi:hypothetical protein